MRKFFMGLVVGLLLWPLTILVSARLGLFSVHATAEPPAWERAFARSALAASVSRSAPQIQNPIPATDEELLTGMKLYRDNCAGCHGDVDRPSSYGASFYPPVPQFPQDPPGKPDWQMFWIVKHGIRYSGMGAWDKQEPDQKIWEIVTFLNHLNSLPPTVAAEWHKKEQR